MFEVFFYSSLLHALLVLNIICEVFCNCLQSLLLLLGLFLIDAGSFSRLYEHRSRYFSPCMLQLLSLLVSQFHQLIDLFFVSHHRIAISLNFVLDVTGEIETCIFSTLNAIDRKDICNVREVINIALHGVIQLAILEFLLPFELIHGQYALDSFLIV